MGACAVVMLTPPDIEVVLASYNGSQYLAEQVESIASQTLKPVRLLISDDLSDATTRDLLTALSSSYGSWLCVLPPPRTRLGCKANFERLLAATEANYVALADQDDFWYPDKLERSMHCLQQLEQSVGSTTPCLVHTDLCVVNNAGEELSSSYFHYQRLDPLRVSPEDLSLTNVVTGCTMLVNRACILKSLPFPHQVAMHDWWMAMVASEFGAIHLFPYPTVDYRQHAANSVGARGVGWHYWFVRMAAFISRAKRRSYPLKAALMQRLAFEDKYNLLPSPLVECFQLPPWRRLFFLSRLPRMHGMARQLALTLLLLVIPRLQQYLCIQNPRPASD